MPLPAAAVAVKAGKLLASMLAQVGVQKPEDVIKVVLVIFFVPVAFLGIFFILPVITFFSAPAVRPSQVQYYVDAAAGGAAYGMNVNWEELLAIDTALLEQDFAGASAERSQDMLWSYLYVNYVKYILVQVAVPDGEGGYTYVSVWERAGEGVLSSKDDIIAFIRTTWGIATESVLTALRLITTNSGVDGGGVKYVFSINARLFEEAVAVKNLTEDQAEWASYLFSQGLASLRAIEPAMPAGWRPEPTGPFAWPVPGSYEIKAKFGPMICKIEPFDGFHTGIDIETVPGSAVLAAHEGIITAAERGRVVSRHLGGYETRYYNLDSIAVSRGDEAFAGDIIGWSGGRFQFEVRRFTRPRDPLEFF